MIQSADKLKQALYVLSCSFLLFLFCTFSFSDLCQNALGYTAMPVCYMVFTAYVISGWPAKGLPVCMAIASIVIGRYVVSLPIHIIDYSQTLGSLPLEILSFVAIFLGILCSQKRSVLIWILSLTLLAIMGSWFSSNWEQWVIYLKWN